MLRLLCLAGLLTAAATSLAADPVEQGFPFEVAAPRANWEWDQDERFEELIEQLAINEASLEAIDVAIARKTRSSRSRQSSARRFDDNNRLMDRKGGGPMNWREFYGTNAEKFFYHPVDPSTTYHTRTYLQQAGKEEDDKSGSDIPTRQSLPVHQRPPQWDYIYRANRTAREQALADAATLQSEVAQLEERRLLLEQEQAELWCRLAFRAVRRHDMHRKPVVRFAVLPAGTTPDAVDHAEALSAAATFFSTALQVVMKADEDQPVALVSAKPLIVKAWYDLDDAMLGKDSLATALNDTESPLGQFMALAKMLSDKARTLTESFEGTRDTIAVNDPIRKDRYRGMLQRAVVDYAQIVLGLEELLDVMQQDWAVKIDSTKQISSSEPTWNDAPAPLTTSKRTASAAERSSASTSAAMNRQTASPRERPAAPNTKDGNWKLVIHDTQSYREHWSEFPNTAYFYDPRTNIISADGAAYGLLGRIKTDEPWKELYFELAVQHISFGRFEVIVNGKPFKIGHAVKNAKTGVPIRVIYLPEEQSAKLLVGTSVAAETNVFEPHWNASLRCGIAGGAGGHTSAVKIRNISILQTKE